MRSVRPDMSATAIQPAVQDEPAPDAGSDGQKDHVVGCVVEPCLGPGGDVGVVVDDGG